MKKFRIKRLDELDASCLNKEGTGLHEACSYLRNYLGKELPYYPGNGYGKLDNLLFLEKYITTIEEEKEEEDFPINSMVRFKEGTRGIGKVISIKIGYAIVTHEDGWPLDFKTLQIYKIDPKYLGTKVWCTSVKNLTLHKTLDIFKPSVGERVTSKSKNCEAVVISDIYEEKVYVILNNGEGYSIKGNIGIKKDYNLHHSSYSLNNVYCLPLYDITETSKPYILPTIETYSSPHNNKQKSELLKPLTIKKRVLI